MNPYRRLPSNARGTSTRHNIHQGLVTALVSLSEPVPATPVGRPPRDITRPSESATERRQPLTVDDAHAAQTIGLEAAHVGIGEQGVGHEVVAVEDRVVLPHAPESTPAEKSVADVLRHAALIIEERGWCQLTLREPTGPVCVWGGIRTALFGDEDGHAYDRDRRPVQVLSHFLGLPVDRHEGLPEIVSWNDEPGRTAAEVTAALRAAADEADR